jgi:acetoacetyl-CoA synthetase
MCDSAVQNGWPRELAGVHGVGMTVSAEPELLYTPGERVTHGAQALDFLRWLRATARVNLTTWDELRAWSVDDLEGFWAAIWAWCSVRAHSPYESVLAERVMPGAKWFSGSTLNYAEHCLGNHDVADAPAVIAYSQARDRLEYSGRELADQVRRARAGLQRLGVRRGDRVVAYLPNIPETLVAFLATASLGAIWASTAPEFGVKSVVDRFAQVEPKVLLTIDGYVYGDKVIDRRDEVRQIISSLPTLEHTVHVALGDGSLAGAVPWAEFTGESDDELVFDAVPFDHPLYVLFSSGTTGLPKPIVHSHGGILLEHFKNHRLHWDLRPGDRLLWFTTTAWMMWNSLVSGLLVGATIVMIDGNPVYPDVRQQWRWAEETRATLMGASPAFLMACRDAGVQPAEEFDLSALRQFGVVGSPFSSEGYHWFSEQFGDQVLLNVGSGGTDVCTGLVQGSPLQSVWVGEMSGASLGVDVCAFDEAGAPIVGALGELVIRLPMPSMPVGFWGDATGERLRSAYFSEFDGVFRFGDWCRFTSEGSCRITGRSDATLNRGGVRLGTAEFYRVLDELPGIADSLVIHLEDPEGGTGELLLFAVPSPGRDVDESLRHRIRGAIRTALSPRHVPDAIHGVDAIPYGRTGKKLEVPVKRILRGASPADVVSLDALVNPEALDTFVEWAAVRAEQVR